MRVRLIFRSWIATFLVSFFKSLFEATNDMTPTVDAAQDPLHPGQTIPVNDPRYTAVSLYYHLLPIYQRDVDAEVEKYKRRYHDYAVNFLIDADRLHIKTRPPELGPAPVPGNVHHLMLNSQYAIVITEGPACPVTPDPDPNTDFLKPITREDGTQDNEIVHQVAAASPTGAFPVDSVDPSDPLSSMTKSQLITMIHKLLGA